MMAVILFMWLGGACGEGAVDESDATAGESPLMPEQEELLDILREADREGCERSGEGWPIGECPQGCEPAPSPSSPIDLERQCSLTVEDMGGPAVCVVEGTRGGPCSAAVVCRQDSEGRIALIGAMRCWNGPEGWSEVVEDCPPTSSEVNACNDE